MREAMRWVAPIASTGLVGIVFLVAGVLIGAKRGHAVVIQPATSYRFQPLADGKALDSKTGQECIPYNDSAQGIHPPPGYTLDGSCEQLAQH